MKKYVLLMLLCLMPISLFSFRRRLIKKVTLNRPPPRIVAPQKVQPQAVEQVIKADDVPKTLDTNIADKSPIDPVEPKLNDITEIVADEPVESKDEIVESTVETVVQEEQIIEAAHRPRTQSTICLNTSI